MFVDQAKIKIKAGDGGDGAVSFHREKYVAAGGPDGGDGGKGGDIIFQVDDNFSTLIDFRYQRKYVAQRGENGGARNCTGRSAPDLIIRVPRGTVIRNAATGRIMADLSTDEPKVLAKGGRGGKGNIHFATSTRQIPRFAKPGFPGEEFEVTLELKLLADVGLVGYPNVGKSTLISVVSAAKPKIANYHFTTITPVLGVVRVAEEQSFVMADIPGLIEGASDGVGLGHEFLRHVERCRLIIHVVDASGMEGRDPIEDYETIQTELERFSEDLAKRPQLLAANKCDLATPEQIDRLKAYAAEKASPSSPSLLLPPREPQNWYRQLQVVLQNFRRFWNSSRIPLHRKNWNRRLPCTKNSMLQWKMASIMWMQSGWNPSSVPSIWKTILPCNTSSVFCATAELLHVWRKWGFRKVILLTFWALNLTLYPKKGAAK